MKNKRLIAASVALVTALSEYPRSCSADSSGRRYTDLF